MSHNNLDYNNYIPYLTELTLLCKFFRKYKWVLTLYGGTLLGAARNNDFIPTDDDIDILYISKARTQREAIIDFESNVIPKLQEKNYEVKAISWTVHKKVRKCIGQYHLIHNNIVLDLFVAWIDKNDKFFASHCILGTLQKNDIFPLTSLKLKNEFFNVPKRYDLVLTALYTASWTSPSNYRPSLNNYFVQKKILKLIDQYGWAYHFIAKSQKKYSVHQIDYIKIDDFQIHLLADYDILYIPAPGISLARVKNIIAQARTLYPDIKIIGAYAGETENTYSSVDLVVSISAKFLPTLKTLYPSTPVIFLPEGTDCNFFIPKKLKKEPFVVGYAGRTHAVKRLHLMNKLNFKVKKKTDHDKEFLVENRTLEPMKEFYHSIDCLILTSSTECMPGVVLEAMACGLPVISTNVGSIELLLDTKCIITPNPDEVVVEEMNSKLKYLKQNYNIRKNIGKRNREYVEKYFNWQNIQELWDNIFNALYIKNLDNIYELTQTYYKQFPILIELDSQKLPSKVKVAITKSTTVSTSQSINTLPPMVIKPKTTLDILNYLFETNVEFWLLKDSCYEAVIKKSDEFSKLYIGVRNQTLKDKLDALNFSENLEISVEPNRKIKSFQLNKKIFFVPLPVISYLEQYTHKSWQILQNEQ